MATEGVTDFQVNVSYADQTIDLGGSARAAETLFQLLYLVFTAPRVDSAALRSWASLAKYEGGDFTIQDAFSQLLANGEPRLLPVSTDMAELLTPQEAEAAFRDRFGNAADFTFVIVGAITPARARSLVQRYLASLPSTRESVGAPKPLEVRPRSYRTENSDNVLPVPKARTMIFFDGPFPSTPSEYLTAWQRLQLLVTVLDIRIRNRLRMQLSADYSPWIDAKTYELPFVGQPSERFLVTGSFMSTPQRMRALWKGFEALLDSARTTVVSQTELERAATIARRQHETDLEGNEYWLDQIILFHRLGIPLARIVHPEGDSQVTPEQLKAAAEQYLRPNAYIHLTRMPEDTLWRARRSSGDSASAGGHSPP